MTDTLCLWGVTRRRRPPCTGDCGRAHLPLNELVRAVEVGAARCGQRLHMRRHEASALARWTALLEHTAPTSTAPAADDRPLGGGGSGGAEWSFHVAPHTVSDEAVEAELALRRPQGLRVAIDLAYDDAMTQSERRSLATQVSLCLSLVSQPERRGHLALALCFGGAAGDAGASQGVRASPGAGGGVGADAADGAGSSLALLHAAAKGSLAS